MKDIEKTEKKRIKRCKTCIYSVKDKYHGTICKCKEKIKKDEEINNFFYPEEVRWCEYRVLTHYAS